MDFLCRFCKQQCDGKSECNCNISKKDKFIEKYIIKMINDTDFEDIFKNNLNTSYNYTTTSNNPEIKFAWTIKIHF